jgi:hypothetical protein
MQNTMISLGALNASKSEPTKKWSAGGSSSIRRSSLRRGQGWVCSGSHQGHGIGDQQKAHDLRCLCPKQRGGLDLAFVTEPVLRKESDHEQTWWTQATAAAQRTFDEVVRRRCMVVFRGSWQRIQHSPRAINPPTASRKSNGPAGRVPKGRNGFMGIPYIQPRSFTSRIGHRFENGRNRVAPKRRRLH